jgi:hypothetical protein
MGLIEELNKSISPEHRRILDVADRHRFGCDCDTCLSWWALCGPDGGEPGSYGPFTKEQVNTRQKELGETETP